MVWPARVVVVGPSGLSSPSANAAGADRGVEGGDLVSGVGDDEAGLVGQGMESLDVGGVDAQLAAGQEAVEDLSGAFTAAHQQTELGVLGILEAVNDVEAQPGVGWGDLAGVVEDASAADGGELVTVADQDDSGSCLVGDGDQGQGGVLVEHAGLVDEQDVAAAQCRRQRAHATQAHGSGGRRRPIGSRAGG